MTTPPTWEAAPCDACGAAVETFSAWFTEDCPATAAGHKLSWLKIMRLRFLPHTIDDVEPSVEA